MRDALQKHWVPVRAVFPELDMISKTTKKTGFNNINKQGDETLKKDKKI